MSDKLTLKSPAFDNYGTMPERHACGGENVSPPFEIDGVPEDARSLALIMDDPDAPGGTWAHWLIWNIPPDTRKLPEAEEPKARYGVSSSGTLAYHGPCPTYGVHQYVFKLYALDTELDLPTGSPKAKLLEAIKGHVLAEAQLIGLYERKH